MSTHDVIIVGAGAAGSAAAFHLARRGASVLALDRSTAPNASSSHSGVTRIVRQAYFEHPDYVPLLRRAFELWRELESLGGHRLLFTPGALYTGPEGGALIRGCLAAARTHGIPLHEMARDQVPRFRVPDGHVALFEPGAGFVLADSAIRTHVALARAAGARVHESEPARRWRADASSVTVQTDTASYSARTLVLAAGAWMPELAGLGVPLAVTRQTLAWFEAPPGPGTGPDPVWASMDDDDTMYYGFPSGAGGPGLKAARHHPGTVIDPDRDSREAPAADVELVARFLHRRLSRPPGPRLDAMTCLYTSTPDQHFILDIHPEHGNVIVASPCSGHGFKFAPVMGEAIADLATLGNSRLPIQFLSLKRLRGGCSTGS